MIRTSIARRILLTAIFQGALIPALAQDAAPKDNVQYKWAFVARSNDAGKHRLGVITRDTSIKSGDEFKMFVNAEKMTYVYVIHKSSDGELNVLFPYDSSTFSAEFKTDKNYYIPKGREWFRLDKNTGPETFYLLASSERLTDLEKTLHVHSAAETGKRAEAATMVVNEIKDIKKRFRTFSTTSERPISIAGNVRGEKQPTIDPERVDIAIFATEVSAVNFFSKTIIVDHK